MACTVLFPSIMLLLVKIKMKTIIKECMENYTLCDYGDYVTVVKVVEQAKPEGHKTKRAQQGEWFCDLTMHHRTKTKLTPHENQAIELGEVKVSFEVEDQTEQDEESFQRTFLDVGAVLGSTNLL
jgi:hypothetical protein